MNLLPPVEQFTSSSGVDIYRLPLVLFPNNFTGHAFLLEGAGALTLVDTGSGIGRSNDDLLHGFRQIGERFGRSFALADIERVIITHGHIDHFGGLAFVKSHTNAEVGIHELDRRVLTNYEERVIVATKSLGIYFERAGISPALRETLFEMYGFAKKHVTSIDVDFSLEDEGIIDGMEFIHTPGHCPGQVCIRLGDVLLSADHVLSRTTPHQSPESITHYMGLDHYADSLRKLLRYEGIRLALGGHEDTIHDLYGRIQAIRASHNRKLDRIRKIMRDNGAPMTISQISKAMYPDVGGYHILLAIEEAGAHIEYLYQHGRLTIANLKEFEAEPNPAILYELHD
ncbi:MAG: MBL fold metallo-hydrolase [Chloroflexota bacterium]|nr:MBL fold metallo-hydrolase [Chloroflexota bacterium]